MVIYERCFGLSQKQYAAVAELADALDLGSSVPDVKVQVLSAAPKSTSLSEEVLFTYYIIYADMAEFM